MLALSKTFTILLAPCLLTDLLLCAVLFYTFSFNTGCGGDNHCGVLVLIVGIKSRDNVGRIALFYNEQLARSIDWSL